jgi:hypothetical protein
MILPHLIFGALPVTAASGMVQRGIIAGKLKGAMLSIVRKGNVDIIKHLLPCTYTEGQPPCVSVHILTH